MSGRLSALLSAVGQGNSECDRILSENRMICSVEFSSLSITESQQLKHRLSLFPSSDVEAFRCGVSVFPDAQRDRRLFDWVMQSKPPVWYAQYSKALADARALSERELMEA